MTLKNLPLLDSIYIKENNMCNFTGLVSELGSTGTVTVTAKDQLITFDTIVSYSALAMSNPVFNLEGVPIIPWSISNDGKYTSEGNTIKWANLSEDIDILSFEFDTAKISSSGYFKSLSESVLIANGIINQKVNVSIPNIIVNSEIMPTYVYDNEKVPFSIFASNASDLKIDDLSLYSE